MKQKTSLIFLTILSIQVLVVTYFALGKQSLFLDETFSYNLANGLFFPSAKEFFNTKLTQEFWVNAFAVSPSEVWDFTNVWANQARDVHPPFYYALLHIICGLFPGKFSIMMGISLNLIFFSLAQVVLYAISRKILKTIILLLLQ